MGSRLYLCVLRVEVFVNELSSVVHDISSVAVARVHDTLCHEYLRTLRVDDCAPCVVSDNGEEHIVGKSPVFGLLYLLQRIRKLCDSSGVRLGDTVLSVVLASEDVFPYSFAHLAGKLLGIYGRLFAVIQLEPNIPHVTVFDESSYVGFEHVSSHVRPVGEALSDFYSGSDYSRERTVIELSSVRYILVVPRDFFIVRNLGEQVICKTVFREGSRGRCLRYSSAIGCLVGSDDGYPCSTTRHDICIPAAQPGESRLRVTRIHASLLEYFVA